MRRLAIGLAGLALLAGCGVPDPSGPSEARQAAPAAVEQTVAQPASIDIPKIAAHSTLEPSGQTPEGGWEVAPLDRPMQATWYVPGPEPGEPGPSVILGHVNGDHRPGIFARLHELAPGDEVVITDVAGLQRKFSVTKVETSPKDHFDPARVLAPTDQRQLRLITCGGELERTTNGGNYVDNVIAYAVQV